MYSIESAKAVYMKNTRERKRHGPMKKESAFGFCGVRGIKWL